MHSEHRSRAQTIPSDMDFGIRQSEQAHVRSGPRVASQRHDGSAAERNLEQDREADAKARDSDSNADLSARVQERFLHPGGGCDNAAVDRGYHPHGPSQKAGPRPGREPGRGRRPGGPGGAGQGGQGGPVPERPGAGQERRRRAHGETRRGQGWRLLQTIGDTVRQRLLPLLPRGLHFRRLRGCVGRHRVRTLHGSTESAASIAGGWLGWADDGLPRQHGSGRGGNQPLLLGGHSG
mmetsp:Transcript_37185/g.106785  ORF Transcript_37185/g.106785 Transcript_37185/m.106785 type:complete len:236 (-) Transcript_37185:406-1113(-)